MKVYLKDLPKDLQKEVKSILNGNGLKVRDVIIYVDGSRVALEIKETGQMVSIN